ncbi:MAG: aspartate--tRNA ligase [Dehalococcoidales bacterium]|nr:aspartate--tRNA ligase [Dehalococcoidales bacterium]
MLKTHNATEVNNNLLGQTVTLAGWVDRRRDHGSLIFIDLRDVSGVIQLAFNPEVEPAAHETGSSLRNEYVVQVTGKVALRPEGTKNPRLITGDIEIIVKEIVVLSRSKTPPFYINEEVEVDENVRLRYRYLDLRRQRMKNNILTRHRVIRYMRNFLDSKGFAEVDTPILIKSTPEGARDYLVPSRVYPGKFYALPQSPQQMKQLLMVAGLEKYYQIAKCFRDEDTRADRQPEFTQLDIEMSFVEENDIMELMEELFTGLVGSISPDIKIITPFTRLTYAEAMERYGCDKPDLRYGLEIKDVTDIAAGTSFGVFQKAVSSGGRIRAIAVPGCGGYSRRELDRLQEIARSTGAGGVVTVSLGKPGTPVSELEMEDIHSIAAKYMDIEQIRQVADMLEAAGGDLLLLAAGDDDTTSAVLDRLRREMAHRLALADEKTFHFCYVTNFPLFYRDTEHNRWDSMHHPFTSPREEDKPVVAEKPGEVYGRHYDLVLNGYEIAGGSIRIHEADLQRTIFRLLAYTDEQIDERFGHMLEAFSYGAPPHGGIAAGIDRFVMLLCQETSIREVIPFPKNQNAQDLTFGAPDFVADEQLEELQIKLDEKIIKKGK